MEKHRENETEAQPLCGYSIAHVFKFIQICCVCRCAYANVCAHVLMCASVWLCGMQVHRCVAKVCMYTCKWSVCVYTRVQTGICECTSV
jgi:hypothetical protein